MATPAAGYSGKGSIARLGLKDGAKAIAIAPSVNDAALTDNAAFMPKKTAPASGSFDFIHLCVGNEAALARDLPGLEPRLATGGMLWVSWPKNSARSAFRWAS